MPTKKQKGAKNGPGKTLESFENPHPERDYIIEIETPEFTCVCPKTGQPDFATIQIEYVPDKTCIELKSLKLYYWSYRDEGAFHEKVTNTILDDLVAAIGPRYLHVNAIFNVRGGVYTTIQAEYRQPGWQPLPPAPDHLPREKQDFPGDRTDHGVKKEPGVTQASKARPAETSVQTPEQTAKKAADKAVATRRQRFPMLGRARHKAPDAPPETAPEITPASPAQELPPDPEQRLAPGHQHTETLTMPPTEGLFVRDNPVYLGIDLGTTGCRIVAVNASGHQITQAESPIASPARRDNQVTQDPDQWWQAVSACLDNIFQVVEPKQIHSIAVDGTSNTILLCDKRGVPVTTGLMYNDSRAQAEAALIAKVADKNSGAHGGSSSLSKLLWLQNKQLAKKAAYVLHQSDWITGKFMGAWGHTDHNNALKLGFNPETLNWPDWFSALKVETRLLPEVTAPGEDLGTISPEIAMSFGMANDTNVVAGTTDGTAAFLAAGATTPGHGVTSLGSTLVIKLLSKKPVFSPEHGVYSHRLGNQWLAGGASNSGGAVLLQYFKPEQMTEMTQMLDPGNLTGLDYYPLPAVGERFPVNDPDMVARLEPLPSDSVTFFQAMLEGIANIEAQGYRLLADLGAPKVAEIRTTGGGSHNQPWQRIRENITGAKMAPANSDLSAYGTALLALGIIKERFQ